LESNPLDENMSRQGESALKAIGDAHDIHVPLCPSFLSEFNGMKYAFSHAITRQFMLASAVFMIENPGKGDDRNATNLGGNGKRTEDLRRDPSTEARRQSQGSGRVGPETEA
jgi:hypothetical protein